MKETIMAKYTLQAIPSGFIEADTEFVQMESGETKSIVAETEGTSWEDVKAESVGESLESLMEGAQAYGYGYTRRSPSSYVNKQLLKTFTIIVKKLVEKIKSNPRTRPKLQAATHKGPTAVSQLLIPSVTNMLPSYFGWMAAIYVPLVTLALFDPICRELGVKAEEVEEQLEIFPIFAALGALFSAGTFGINLKKHRKQKQRGKRGK
jgi:hypothetical protein